MSHVLDGHFDFSLSPLFSDGCFVHDLKHRQFWREKMKMSARLARVVERTCRVLTLFRLVGLVSLAKVPFLHHLAELPVDLNSAP